MFINLRSKNKKFEIQNRIVMYSDYYLYYFSYLSSLYSGYPLIIRVTVILVMVLACITLLGIIRLLFIGYKINKKDKRNQKLKEEFEEKLTFTMSNEINYDVEEIRNLLDYKEKKSRKWKSELLTDLVLEVRDELKKESRLNQINYRNCLEVFGLTSFWDKRVRTTGLSKRRTAMQTMGSLDAGVNTGALSKSVFHKNSYLRKTARNIYSDHDSYNPFRFMEENFDESFTQLDKIRLHATLVKRSNEGKLPNLMRWVNNSKHSNYIAFVIQEIGFFKQYEAAPSLLELLDKHENREVRIQIVLTLGELGYHECIPDLVKRFPLESTPVRSAIIKTFGKIKGDLTLEMLFEAYESTDDDNFKISIVRAMKAHGDKGKQSLLMLKEKARKEEELIINQVFAENVVVTG